jgi:aryl-alcohol dehydrogenase-like predicted oxidoreductase
LSQQANEQVEVSAVSRITAAIVGGRNAKQVEGVASAINFRLTEAEFSEINPFLDANL